MIRHIVMWSFKKGTEAAADQFLNGLLKLNGVIPQIASMQVSKSCNPENEYHAVLIADFRSLEDLNTYKNDPRHLKVASICKEIRISRSAIDIKVPDQS